MATIVLRNHPSAAAGGRCPAGSVPLNGEKLTDPKAEPSWKEGDVLKLDKKRTVRIGG